MTGETIRSNMSGAAIAQLQSQAQQPIEELKDSFWQVKEKQGKVMAQFFKLYYANKEFTYKESAPKKDRNKQPITQNGIAVLEETQFTDVFNGSDYANVDFDVVVETTSGTKASAAGDINALDVLLAKGLISIKTYLKAYPKDALANRTEIIKGIEEDEQSQVAQLTRQLQQAQEQLLQSTQLIQQQKETVDKVVSVIQENNQLKTVVADLYTEAKTKIQEANRQIELGNRKINETTQDATEFAQVIASQMPTLS